jgi:hypothetical protein
LKIRGVLFLRKGPYGEAQRRSIPKGAVTEAQRSQRVFCAKTPWAAVLLSATFVGSALKARCGDSRASLPRLRPKSLAAEPLGFLKHTLKHRGNLTRSRKLRVNKRSCCANPPLLLVHILFARRSVGHFRSQTPFGARLLADSQTSAKSSLLLDHHWHSSDCGLAAVLGRIPGAKS